MLTHLAKSSAIMLTISGALLCSSTNAQVTIRGTVTDRQENPVIGLSIFLVNGGNIEPGTPTQLPGQPAGYSVTFESVDVDDEGPVQIVMNADGFFALPLDQLSGEIPQEINAVLLASGSGPRPARALPDGTVIEDPPNYSLYPQSFDELMGVLLNYESLYYLSNRVQPREDGVPVAEDVFGIKVDSLRNDLGQIRSYLDVRAGELALSPLDRTRLTTKVEQLDSLFAGRSPTPPGEIDGHTVICVRPRRLTLRDRIASRRRCR